MNDANYELPYYVFFSSLQSPSHSWARIDPILIRTLLSDNLNLFSSLNAGDQVSHKDSTSGKIIIQCILISRLNKQQAGRENFLKLMVASISRF
jgi:hypothetical protein